MEPAPAMPIDMAHLSRYTGGDAALDAEVLRLFVEQTTALVQQLGTAVKTGDRQAWQHVTHSLKGASRGVGAFRLAQIVADAEPLDCVAQAEGARTAVRALEEELASVARFVAGHLSG